MKTEIIRRKSSVGLEKQEVLYNFDLTFELRVWLDKSLVFSVFLHGVESWILSEALMRLLTVPNIGLSLTP